MARASGGTGASRGPWETSSGVRLRGRPAQAVDARHVADAPASMPLTADGRADGVPGMSHCLRVAQKPTTDTFGHTRVVQEHGDANAQEMRPRVVDRHPGALMSRSCGRTSGAGCRAVCGDVVGAAADAGPVAAAPGRVPPCTSSPSRAGRTGPCLRAPRPPRVRWRAPPSRGEAWRIRSSASIPCKWRCSESPSRVLRIVSRCATVVMCPSRLLRGGR